MNFWKRYPADYQRKTARLTLAQHGAYSLLLDEIYTTEAPLPSEIDELYRICRAMSRLEQQAVDVVAERYFPVGEDGVRRNKRASEELEEAAPAVQAARENGRKGGRPKKPKGNPAGSGSGNPVGIPTDNPLGFQTETQTEPSAKAPHSSDLREEKTPAARPPLAAVPLSEPVLTAKDLIAEGVEPGVARDWLKVRKTKKAPLTRTAWDGVKREAAIAGMTISAAVKHAAESNWQGFKAVWLQRDQQTAAGRQTETPHHRQMRETHAALSGGRVASGAPPAPPKTVTYAPVQEVIDAIPTDLLR